MDTKLFIECARRLHPLQACYLTFMPGSNGIAGLKRLVALTRSHPSVRIETHQNLDVLCVVEFGQWESIGRTITVYDLMRVDPELLSPMARDIERIAAGDHFAKALFTTKQAKKLAAATTIIGSVLNQSILDKVESWGARIDGKLAEIDGIPAVVFTLFNNEDGTELVKVSIDGWSGRTSVGNAWGDTRCIDPQQIRELIYSALTDHIDAVTK